MSDRADRLLRVDLTAGTVESERVPERWLREYVGGKGLAARYLYEELDAGVDPLGPENRLAFVLGPVSGLTPGDAQYAAVTRSPLSGAFLDSYAGGSFPARLAGALDGHLGVLVQGASETPVVLEVEDGKGTLAPAGELWGADVAETCAAFPEAGVACAGPAGEHRVRFATIGSDGGDHQAGRGGAGAVMGAKGLKAVVAHGEPPTALADLRERYRERLESADAGRWQAASGTLETVDFADEVGVLPTRGWQSGTFEGADRLGIDAVREAAVGRERPGEEFPGDFRVDSGDDVSVPRGGTPIALGSGLGIDDFDAVAVLGADCDRLGVDAISVGNAVAWAIRASETGVLDRDLSFGDEAAARSLVAEIATRTGELGDALADGVDAAADRFGGEELVPTVKSMALPSYDPRGSQSMALAYATSDRGACHRRAQPVFQEVFATEEWSAERRAEVVVAEQNARSVLWSLIVDDVVSDLFAADLGAEWLAAVGLDYDREELARVGERVWTLTRLFNVREGFARADDSLPPTMTRPLQDGPQAGARIDPAAFQRTLTAYYARRGWSDDGIPTRALLDRLSLGDVVDEETPVADDPASPPE